MGEPIIDVKGLSKTFGTTKVVDDFSLTVEKGEIYGFLGPNGSGKTTTIRMLCGLLLPDSVSGHCLGMDILKDADKIKLQVGYMTQRFSLYADMTAYENLDFIARLYNMENRKQLVEAAVEEFGIGKQRQHQLAGNLSGGWKQRIALAAALIHKPTLLLLDEPTAGVDPKARRDFWDHIHRLSAQGITTLVSTHYMDEAERCHRLAYLAYGRLLANGTANEIIQHAKMQTWDISGTITPELAENLRAIKEISQVTAFGRNLHVSANANIDLNKVLQPVCKGLEYKQIKPGLEDVFIQLMQGTEDNFG